MKIVFTPDWFLNFDVLIEGFSFLVLLSFFLLSIRNYKLTRNKKTLFLGIGFLVIAVAEIATILTKLVLYYDTTLVRQVGSAVITYHVVRSVDTFYYIGFFFHKLLTLLGLYLIYRLPLKERAFKDSVLIIFFIIISAVFGNIFSFIFHLTVIALVILIIDNYYQVYKKNRSEKTKLLILALAVFGVSHSLFVFAPLPNLYVIAQVLQLASYLTLLALIISILKTRKKGSNGKEEK